MKHQFIKNWWNLLPSWQAVLEDLDLNLKNNPKKVKVMNNFGFVTHNGEMVTEINLIKNYFLQTFKNVKDIDCHVYISLLSTTETSGKHIDPVDVFFIQAHGKTEWTITENNKDYVYILEPGDLIFFEKGIIHKTKPLCPRIGISIGIFYE